MAISTQERTNIIKLVTLMFNAAPGATYLAELTAFYEASDGDSLTKLSALSRALAETSAYKALNPNFQTASEFATAFLTPLGLQANTEAIDFITSRFNQGLSKGQIAFEAGVTLDASTAPAFADAKAIIVNKTAVAEYFSVTKAIAQTSVSSLQSVLASVDATAGSVSTANTAIDNGAGAVAANIFTLTTGIDSLTGTNSNDFFYATNATSGTLNVGDTINGGAGTDVLNITSNLAGTLAGTFTSVEVINVSNATGVALVSLVASSQAPNASNINMTGAGAVSVTGLAAATQVGMIGAVTSSGNAAAFTVTQTTNGALTLNLAGSSGATGRALTFADAGAATTATINATGTASTLQGVTLPGATTLTVNAAVNVALGGVTDAVLTTVTASGTATTVNIGALTSTLITSINASGLTAGGINVTLANGNAAGVTFVGGAGNDTLNLGSNVITGTAGQLNAGAGTGDTLGLALGSQLTTALAPAYIGFENLALAGATAQTFTVSNLAGITDVSVAGLTTVLATVNGLTALTPQAVTLTGVGQVTLGVTNATTIGTNDTLNVTLSGTNTAATAEVLTIAGVETLNLTAATGTAASKVSALVGASLTAINITGNASPVSFTTGANAIGSNLSLTSTGTGAHTIDFSGATGNAISITSGSGNDVLTGTVLVDVINGGAGNDSIAGGLGLDTLTGDAGADTFSFLAAAGTTNDGLVIGNFDTITDFVVGTDKLQFTTVTDVVSVQQAAVQTAVTALAAGSTAAQIVTAMALANTTNFGVSFATFGGSTYVLYETTGSNTTFTVADDVFIKLTGVTVIPTFAADVVA